MYNIAKVAKGEILLFFNEVFDALCKVVKSSNVLGFCLHLYSLLLIPSFLSRTEQNSLIVLSKT